jgi:glycosyltransferase involved in cell wall biosynthesis
MHVSMVSYHYFPGNEGGAERQCRLLAETLVCQGVSCRVYTARTHRSFPKLEFINGVEVVRLPCLKSKPCRDQNTTANRSCQKKPDRRTHGLFPSRFLAEILRSIDIDIFLIALTLHLSRHKTDILHVHSTTSIAGYCSWLGKRRGIAVLIKEASYPAFLMMDSYVPGNWIWRNWRKRAFCQAQHDAAAYDLASKGVDPSNIFLIPNGIELPDLSLRSETPDKVLFVGNLTQSKYKALDVLFSAWPIVQKNFPSTRLYIAGRGDASPWQKMLDRLACRDSVFFEGHVADLTQHYAQASVFVLPSRQEGMSNALLEAQSWGIATVVSDIEANQAVIADGYNGIVVATNNAKALADGIIRMLGNINLRNQLGNNGRRLMEENHSINAVSKRLKDAYKTMLGSSQQFKQI